MNDDTSSKHEDRYVAEIEHLKQELERLRGTENEPDKTKILLENILQVISELVLVTAPDGTILYLNDTVSKLKIFPPKEDLIGKNQDVIFSRLEIFDENGNIVPSENTPANLVLQGIVTYRKVYCYRHKKTKQEIWGMVNTVPVFDEEHNLKYAIHYSQNITRFKRTENYLRQEKERIQQYLDVVGGIFVVLDREGMIILINQEGCRLLEYPEEELLGKEWFELALRETERETFRQQYHHLMKQAGDIHITNYQNPVLTKSGEIRTIEWQYTILRDDTRTNYGILGYGTDITERIMIEEKLRREASINLALAELSNSLIDSTFNLKNICLLTLKYARSLTRSEHGYVSVIDPANGANLTETLTEMMGNECKVTGKNLKTVFPPDPDGRYHGLWGYALNTRQPFYTNTPQHHPNAKGTPSGHIPLSNFLSVPAMIGGRLVGQIALANNPDGFTDYDLEVIEKLANLYALALERARMIENIRIREFHLNEAQQRTKFGSWEVNLVTGEVYWSDEMFRLFGQEPGTQIPTFDEFREFLHPQDREMVKAYQDQSLIQPQKLSFEVRTNPDDGPVRILSFIVMPGPHENGQRLLAGSVMDITEQKKMEGNMLASQKMANLGTLAAGVAHEINSPLQVITGMTDSLLRRVDQNKISIDDLPRELNIINRNAWRIAKIVRSLLAYARPSIGEKSLQDLNDIIKDALLLTEHQLKSWSNIEIVVDLHPNLPFLLCDRNSIIQVLLNLIHNAADAMPNGGEITIRTSEEPQHILLRVTDTGSGIPEEIIQRIYDPFFSTKPIGKGTGLGLSIVFGIVKAHNAELQVDSSHQGTTFTIRFPANETESHIHHGTSSKNDRFDMEK